MSGDHSWKRQEFGLRARPPAEDDRSLVELADLLLDDGTKANTMNPARGRTAPPSDASEPQGAGDQMDIDLLIQTFERRLARADDLAREERLAAKEAGEARRAIEAAQKAEDEAIAAMIAAAEAREAEARAEAERESLEFARLREEAEAQDAAEKIEAERQAAEAEALLAAAQAEAEAARLAAEREAEARAAALREAEERERAAREAMERAEEARARAAADAAEREHAARERLAREQAERAEALKNAEARRAAALEAIERERLAREEAIAEAERRREVIAARLRREAESAAIPAPVPAPALPIMVTAEQARDMASAPAQAQPRAEARDTRSTDKRYDDRFKAIFDQFEAQISEIGARPMRPAVTPPPAAAGEDEMTIAAPVADNVIEVTAEPEPAPRVASMRLRDAVASIAERQRDLQTPPASETTAPLALSRQMPLGPALEKLAETAAQIGVRPEAPPPPALPAAILADIQTSIQSLTDRFERRDAERTSEEPAIREAIEGLAERLDSWSQTGGRDADAAIERAVETIIARIEQTAIEPRQLENIERSLEDVMRQLRDGQHLAADAVETAANSAVRRAMEALDARPNPRLDAIEQRLADLVADAMGTERRTLDALDAVRESLQHVASRLPADAQKVVAPIAQSLGEVSTHAIEAAERARAAARRAMAEAREEDALAPERAASFGSRQEPPVSPAAASERARFIAAARRSMEEGSVPAVAAPREQMAPAAEQENSELIDFQSRAQRLQKAASAAKFAAPSRRRQAYVGIAAALLLAGSFGAVSHVISQNDAAEETTAALPGAEPAEERTVTAALGAPETYRPTVEDKTQAQVTAPDQESARDLAVAEPLDQSGIEDIITGSIGGTAAPEAPPALPVEIGSPRLRSAATDGDASAQYEIGARYSEGRNVPADGAKAVEWLTRAADQGLAPAQYRLGSIFEKGTGVARDPQAAERWYSAAAAQGNVKAMHNLGVLYAEGGLGTPDFAAAANWFEKAAEHGVADSQYNLGVIYTRGLGAKADFSSAYHWFAQAAARGDQDAGNKRDQVGGRLDAKALAAAKKRVADWKPQPELAAANIVPVPTAGWDDPATAQHDKPARTTTR